MSRLFVGSSYKKIALVSITEYTLITEYTVQSIQYRVDITEYTIQSIQYKTSLENSRHCKILFNKCEFRKNNCPIHVNIYLLLSHLSHLYGRSPVRVTGNIYLLLSQHYYIILFIIYDKLFNHRQLPKQASVYFRTREMTVLTVLIHFTCWASLLYFNRINCTSCDLIAFSV